MLFVYLDKNELAMGKSVLQPFHNKSDEISLHLPLQAEDEEWLDFHNGMYEGRNEFLQYVLIICYLSIYLTYLPCGVNLLFVCFSSINRISQG